MDDVVLLEPEAETAPTAPQLRTILLTDICDSTIVVEQLGDGGTAQFFREHDRLVLRLQQQWRGRLIDRSDGLLLLFERPIDGLGFALDYGRGLAEVGKLRHLDIRTRAGLHVGEVLTWRNSDEAVRLGAKPVEVEGLAKPIAARLMSIARPGQVLMSAVAEPLAHRAARELGERGQQLIWKSHGVWQFKGVAERQQIFEVGEPGVAPLRTPPDTLKAWRDVPLWRRPALLAAEAALLAAVAIGGWFATRPPPAIAFNERDWVVVGDLRNLTGDARLDDSLEQAFRISLEQSRFVNVLSDLKVRDTLARMRLDPGTAVDRALAAQIAQRDGARAVILPTVSEVGGRLRFSVEVIDPHSQTTVYAHAADGKGEASVLASIDEVTGALRADLGEAVAQIDKDSRPLPEVTTGSLDALRAYALGQAAYSRGDQEDAGRLYQKALELDPEFALAWLGRARVAVSTQQAQNALAYVERAKALRSQLPPRDALYVEAWEKSLVDPANALAAWKLLAGLYPDYFPAQGNVAIGLYQANRFREALPLARRVAEGGYELATRGHDILGRAYLALEQYDRAATSFDDALAAGYAPAMRRRATVELARGNLDAGERLLTRYGEGDRYSQIEQISVALDRGEWDEANARAKRALSSLQDEPGFDGRMFLLPAAVSASFAGNEGEALAQATLAADRAMAALRQPPDANAVDDAALSMAAALFVLRRGQDGLARRVEAELQKQPELMAFPSLAELSAVLRAETLTSSGKTGQAIAILEPMLTGNEQYQTRVALFRAYTANGDEARALEQAEWLQARRGLAYIELVCAHCMQAMNVTDSDAAARRLSAQ